MRKFKSGDKVRLMLGGHHAGPYTVSTSEIRGDRQLVSIRRGIRGYTVFGEFLRKERRKRA